MNHPLEPMLQFLHIKKGTYHQSQSKSSLTYIQSDEKRIRYNTNATVITFTVGQITTQQEHFKLGCWYAYSVNYGPFTANNKKKKKKQTKFPRTISVLVTFFVKNEDITYSLLYQL